MQDTVSDRSSNLRPPWRLIIEIAAVTLLAAAFARFACMHGGQVFGTDSLMYLDTGLRGLENPFILNRYTHVYLFRFFTTLGTTPLEGLRLYSGFAAGASAILVYACARALSERSSPVNGLIAVGLFLGLPMVIERILAPTVDITVMLLLLGLLAIYIASSRAHHGRSWLIILFGVFFFLALRTKETAIVAGILLLGFGLDADQSFSARLLMRNLGYAFGGMALAALLSIIGNTLIVGSPLFGFRPIDFLEYRQRWSDTLGSAEGSGASFQSLVLLVAGIPFVLYVTAGVLARDRLLKSVRLIWIVPLALITMLILFSTRGEWGIVSRGFLPGIAVVCVLGSQLANFEGLGQKSIKSLLPGVFTALLGIGILGGIGLLSKGDQPFEVYYQAAFAPITLCSILAILFIARESATARLAIVILLLPISLYPVRLNLGEVATRPEVLTENVRFQLILAFEERIQDAEDLNLYMTTSALPLLAIKANTDELASPINVGLDLKTVREQYTIGTPDSALVKALLGGEYSHVLLSSSEWDWLRTEPQDQPEWRRQYESFVEPGNRFVLLQRIESASSD